MHNILILQTTEPYDLFLMPKEFHQNELVYDKSAVAPENFSSEW